MLIRWWSRKFAIKTEILLLGKKTEAPSDGDASSVDVVNHYTIEGRQIGDQQLILEFDSKKIYKNCPDGIEKKKKKKIKISINEKIVRIVGVYPLFK